jgi:hypothetical protein
MLTEKIRLPMGLIYKNETIKEVEIQELSGHEEDMLVDARKIQSGTIITDLLFSCLISIGDIVKSNENGKEFREMVESMLQDDRTFVLIRIRQLSLGDSVTCEIKCPTCNAVNPYDFNLSDFEVTEFETPPSYERNITLPSGKAATIRLLTGKDDSAMTRVKKRSESQLASALLQFHVLELEGVKKPPVNVLKGLSSRDRNFLRNEINKSSGGIDATLDIMCVGCGAEFKTEVPIVGGDFFFPSGVQ